MTSSRNRRSLWRAASPFALQIDAKNFPPEATCFNQSPLALRATAVTRGYRRALSISSMATLYRLPFLRLELLRRACGLFHFPHGWSICHDNFDSQVGFCWLSIFTWLDVIIFDSIQFSIVVQSIKFCWCSWTLLWFNRELVFLDWKYHALLFNDEKHEFRSWLIYNSLQYSKSNP